MRKSTISSIVVGAVLLVSGVALAGQKFSFPVTVTKNADGGGVASGNVGAVRNSTDAVQYITCTSTTLVGSATAGCSAQNTKSVALTCSTTDPEMVAAIRSVTTDSFVKFLSDKDGKCTSVTVENASFYEPKK